MGFLTDAYEKMLAPGPFLTDTYEKMLALGPWTWWGIVVIAMVALLVYIVHVRSFVEIPPGYYAIILNGGNFV